ncbi:MAG: carboxypeptidase regulatory-like domain-containing protein [Bryobacteraceae bacterium]
MEPKTSGRRKAVVWIGIAVGLGLFIVLLITAWPHIRRVKALSGAVVVANSDPRKQLPVPNVEIMAEAGGTVLRARSDSAGFFRLTWPAKVWRGEQVTLSLRRPGYQPLDITQSLDQLCIAHMIPVVLAKENEPARGAETSVGDIRIRYTVKAVSSVNIGSTVKTWEVVNTANVPCNGQPPCSPDGKWKAAIGSISLNAGDGHEFQNVRVSCIAGPCPFASVETGGFARGGRKIDISARAWSDTVTFLVEAEVVQTMLTEAVRQAYPAIFGRDMSFTLPATGQGPSIEAEINGLEIVFPLGPDLSLSWASCTAQVTSNSTRLYSCKLRPGYRFR